MDEPRIKALLIEDNPGDARLIEEALGERGDGAFRLRWADDLADGLDRLAEDPPDVVLLDLSLPGTRGMDTLASVLERSQDVPIIVMTGTDDESLAVEAVRRGAQDYLVKGQTGGALLGRAMRYAIQRKEAQAQLADANARLEVANRRLEELATTDDLTGLWNRRYFLDMLSRECRRTARTGADLALAMVDVDRFKVVNDTHGHPFGDRVLREVAKVMQHEARAADLVARFGGEEFMVLMPETGARDAATAGDRLRRRIADRPVSDGASTARVTVSVGVTSLDGAVDPTGLLRHVDEALYAAKQGGRNRTVVWAAGGPVPAGPADAQAVPAADGRLAPEPRT
ncbi:MAG: diguanylate cyclase [Planctomycetota bacterium]|nr:diguanylate cyclase [Planctomycetota bacterium]